MTQPDRQHETRSDRIELPEVVRAWPGLREGTRLCWAAIWAAAGYRRHSAVKLHVANLAGWLYVSTRSVDRYLDALEAAGLVTVRDRQRGDLLLDLADPLEAAQARQLRPVAPAPQLTLELEELDDQVEAEASPDVIAIGGSVDRTADDQAPTGGSVDRTAETVAREAVGPQRWALYLENCEFATEAGALNVTAPSAFCAERLRRVRRELSPILLEAFDVERVNYDSADRSTEPPKPAPRTNPSKVVGSKEPTTNNQQEQLAQPGRPSVLADTAGQPTNQRLQQRAAHLYRLAGDPTLWRWVTLLAALLEHNDQVSPDELEQLANDSAGDFAQRLRQLCDQRGLAWLTPRTLKRPLRDLGIAWRRSYERGVADERRPRPK